MKNRLASFTVLVVSVFTAPTAIGDEGLYLFSNPPRGQLKENYQFELPASLLDKLQKCSLNIDGGSASFVSPKGLILTNQHVGWHWLEVLTTAERDLVRNGFYARSVEDEIPCPNLQARILRSMEDVTARVHAAIRPDMSARQAVQAREAVIRAIERESREGTGLFSEVVALDQGGTYQLYRYARCTDIRLVFAPEQEVFRIFDVCFFRAYENGRPLETDDHLRFAMGGLQPGELVLVSGFPGSTSRFRTVADLESHYGRRFFAWFKQLGRWQSVVGDFCQQGPENERHGRLEYFGLDNEFSAKMFLWGTLERQLADKRRQEKAFAARLARDPALLSTYHAAQAKIAAALKDDLLFDAHFLLEYPAAAFNSDLFQLARHIVRRTDELARPDAERLTEYSDSHRADAERALFTPKAICKELEIAKLADSLSYFADNSRNDGELVRQILDGKTADERARELVNGSRLDDAANLQALLKGGKKSLAESTDTMIALALLVDARARQVRITYDEAVNEPIVQAYTELARVRAKVLGESTYPDATGSLRLSFGRVQQVARLYGNAESGITCIGDLFQFVESSHQAEHLPMAWQKARHRLSPAAPILFSNSADAVGGNSGSPVVNRDGRLVGVCSIGAKGQELSYGEGRSGSGAVAAAGILEVLDGVYDAGRLTTELRGGEAPAQFTATPPQTSPPWSSPLAPLPFAPSLPMPYMPVSSVRTVAEPVAVPYPRELAPALIDALKDSDAEVVQAAVLGLSKLGGEALPGLINGLQAKENGVRMNAALVIGKMGGSGHSAIPALLKCLQDDNVEVRRAAARALAQVIVEPGTSPSVWTDPSLPGLPVPPPLQPIVPASSPAAPTSLQTD